MSDNEYYSDDSDSESSSDDEVSQVGGAEDIEEGEIEEGEIEEGEIEEGEIEEGEIEEKNDDEEYEDEENNENDNDDSVDEYIDDNGEPAEKPKPIAKKAKPTNTHNLMFDDDDDDDDDDNENYLQKFDSEITKNYIHDFHPECFTHNYDEITKLAVVVRNSDNIIIDPNHKTIPFLTKYEKARVLGQRSKQIESGAKPFVKVPENIIDSYVIAEFELREKKIPFIIRRPLPNGASEYWYIKDLEIIGF